MRTELWSDGSGTREGPGGWAYVLLAYRESGEVAGYVENCGPAFETTNNEMELRAVVEGLWSFKRSTTLTVYSDSEYVLNPIRKGWLERWATNGWRTSGEDAHDVAHRHLWEPLRDALSFHTVTVEHIKGHAAERRCACGYVGGLRKRKCPECGGETTKHDLFPFNARCDKLAGAMRRALIDHPNFFDPNQEVSTP